MVGTGLYIRIFVSMQTQRLDRSARNTFQAFSFVDILDKDRSLFVIQFHTVRNSRRSLCLTYGNRTDIALTLYAASTTRLDNLFQYEHTEE